MSSKRVFFVMIAAVLLLCGAFALVLVLGNKQLVVQANKLQDLKAESEYLSQQKALLTVAQADLEKYGYITDIAKTVVPQDKDQARAVNEINQIALLSGVKIASITFPTSNLGEKQTQQKPTPDATTPGEAPSQQPTQSSPISQAKPVSGITGVYSLEMKIESEAGTPYYSMLNFLERLENNRRTAQVVNAQIMPDPAGANTVQFTITINIFVKP